MTFAYAQYEGVQLLLHCQPLDEALREKLSSRVALEIRNLGVGSLFGFVLRYVPSGGPSGVQEAHPCPRGRPISICIPGRYFLFLFGVFFSPSTTRSRSAEVIAVPEGGHSPCVEYLRRDRAFRPPCKRF